jgi:hypothetical protein
VGVTDTCIRLVGESATLRHHHKQHHTSSANSLHTSNTHHTPHQTNKQTRYVDVLGFLLTLGRKFPLGVAKYVTWPETSWARRLTSTHHLWFIPYCLVLGAVRC